MQGWAEKLKVYHIGHQELGMLPARKNHRSKSGDSDSDYRAGGRLRNKAKTLSCLPGSQEYTSERGGSDGAKS